MIFGIGTLAEVGGAVRRVGGRRPMLVSDPGVLAAGWVERATPHLDDVRVQWHLWHDLTPNPKDFEVEAAYEIYLESGCDALLAIGGGSCIDLAKAVAILSGNGGHILEYEGIDRANNPIPPMVMVPTTGGTGSDVSQFCVVTDTKRRFKVTIGGRALVPEISVTDPELLTTMSAELTAHTGLDALSHAIESCVSEACDFLSKRLAVAAIHEIVEHLPVAVEDPSDLDAREGMARASLQAGHGVHERAARGNPRDRSPDRRRARPPARAAQRDPDAARDALQRRDARRPLRRRRRRARRRRPIASTPPPPPSGRSSASRS